jgi:hypothetical protein
MTRYELEVKMLVDSWVYGGISDLMKKMPEGVLGVNVIGIKKQEGAWDSSCLPCVMKDYEENSPRDEQLSKPSPTERPRHEWDSLVNAMDVRIEAHKNNMSEESKLEPNRKEETKSKKELSEKEEMARLESLPSELTDNFPTTWKLRFDTKFTSNYGYWDIKVDKDSYYFCYFCNVKELSKVYFSSPSMDGVVDYLKKVWRFDFCEELR